MSARVIGTCNTCGEDVMSDRDHNCEVPRLRASLFAARARAEASEAWVLAVADPLGLVNRPEGQSGYEVAPPDMIVAEVRDALARAEKAERERDEARENYEGACVTVAQMHAAAVGEVTGPRRGVVEDVADVRARVAALEGALREIEEHIREEDYRSALAVARRALAGEG